MTIHELAVRLISSWAAQKRAPEEKLTALLELETAILLVKLRAGTLRGFSYSLFPTASRASIALLFYSARGLEPRGFEPLTSSMPLRRSTN